MSYIDCHCHLAENYFYRNIQQFLTKWEKKKITAIGSMATNLKSSRRNLELAKIETKVEIIPGIGRHPWGAHKVSEEEKREFEKLITENQMIVIGEIGLDYYFVRDIEKQKKQVPIFNFFLELGNKKGKPIMLHTTGAEKDILNCLTNIKLKTNICCHWFSGDTDTLKQLIDLNCFFSINQAILKSKAHRKVVKEIRMESMLTESDGPIKFRDQKASPELMPLIIEEIAKIKQMKQSEIKEQITKNFEKYLAN